MKKVDLNVNEQEKYEIIKSLVDRDGNKVNAALKIGCSPRHINRLIAGYKKHGKAYFVHGNRGRKPAHAFSNETKQLIIDLYISKYYDANIEHFCELILEHENIKASPSLVRELLYDEDILSPKAHKRTKRKMREKLRAKQEVAKTKKEFNNIQASILALEESHPRRPRCTYAGEMLQMDASVHEWFGNRKSFLHVAVDDATGNIVGAWFDEQETLDGYYHVFEQILIDYGIPAMFLTDNRTVFEYKGLSKKSIEDNTLTQFGYACKQLGVEIKTTSVPQAKGRVERVFNTLQSRLPVELRLNNVTCITEANEFLKTYLKKFNEQFALPLDCTKSVFEKQPSLDEINLTLARVHTRVIDNGHCFKFMNQYYVPVNGFGDSTYYLRGTKGLVIQAFDKAMYCCINDTVYALELIPDHYATSKIFDAPQEKKEPRKPTIPAKNHPWRSESFYRYLRKEEYRWQKIASKQPLGA